MGRCIDCGFSADRVNPGSAYKLMCMKNGNYKRYGDTCPGYWNRQEMKEFLDKTIEELQKMERGEENAFD